MKCSWNFLFTFIYNKEPRITTRDGNSLNSGLDSESYNPLNTFNIKNGLIHGLRILGILADCGFSDCGF